MNGTPGTQFFSASTHFPHSQFLLLLPPHWMPQKFTVDCLLQEPKCFYFSDLTHPFWATWGISCPDLATASSYSLLKVTHVASRCTICKEPPATVGDTTVLIIIYSGLASTFKAILSVCSNRVQTPFHGLHCAWSISVYPPTSCFPTSTTEFSCTNPPFHFLPAGAFLWQPSSFEKYVISFAWNIFSAWDISPSLLCYSDIFFSFLGSSLFHEQWTLALMALSLLLLITVLFISFQNNQICFELWLYLHHCVVKFWGGGDTPVHQPTS